ncbi:MAG TPA: tetratricopeptide repeat protein [Alphaproteobacteria bacterium]|nr:tetratricopeptide repeat protein [Alphaproteobacteria bacterium]
MAYSFKSPKAAKIFQEAADLHLGGQLDAAEARYRAILKLDPGHYDCLHLLGVIRLQQGRLEDAAEVLRQALRRRPKAAEAHYNLGLVLKDLGRSEEAVACFRNALQLDAKHVEALTALGALLGREGRLDEAVDCYRRATAIKPDDAAAQNSLAGGLIALGRADEAASAARQAIRLKPDYAEAHSNLGDALQGLGRRDEAIACYEKAIALKPGYAEAHNNRGVVLNDLGRLDEAIADYDKALALKPAYPEAHNNRGVALSALGRLEEARADYAAALALRPAFPEAVNNMGLLLADLSQHEAALERYSQAQALRPDYADAHFNEALSRLVRGDFVAGWEKYEWRWRTPLFAGRSRRLTQPQWQGEPLRDATLLLHAEQGLGDTIQFLRYLPLVAARVPNVVLEVQAPVIPLLEALPGVSRIVASGDAPPPHDRHVPLLGLPRIFATRLETIPPALSPLTVPPERAAAWRDALAATPRPRIGLVWAGSRAHKKDRRRSIPLTRLVPLLATTGVQFVSLQKELREGDAEILRAKPNLIAAGERLADFADTAALVAQLDLVITVDTSVAHLAGTMGVPTWLLLPFAPDWRWLLEREDSPWYPSLRLFRQPAPGAWDAVIARLQEALGGFAR